MLSVDLMSQIKMFWNVWKTIDCLIIQHFMATTIHKKYGKGIKRIAINVNIFILNELLNFLVRLQVLTKIMCTCNLKINDIRIDLKFNNWLGYQNLYLMNCIYNK